MSQHHRLPGNHRLKSRKRISALFTRGQAVKQFPIRMQYVMEQPKTDKVSFQVSFVVSKRNVKKAVDRNRIKRQLRECFRLHGNVLRETLEKDVRMLEIMIVYLHKEEYDFPRLEKAMVKCIERLCKKVSG